ncbi:flap endonuclease 1-like [Anneissia japonica]|uniref:flap endonuclease 1-like n=1 Tax=Anneissia japonica TaxID=1529436 RepID=UPI0014256083|nr:flap endonuclease 1-like [Anneissia japonica]
MGILGLARFLADFAPSALREHEIKNYFGRKIAIDASMCIYQFLIAVRMDGSQLTNDDGETTSHLIGMFYRTIRMIENGIKPLYVFDGKPPDMKSGELTKRKERREEAEKQLEKAKSEGDVETMNKFERRLVRVSPIHNEECQTLLKCMGVPFVKAPGEAEAQCAELVKAGKVYAVGTEDMDALTFGSNVLLRHLTSSEAKKLPVVEYQLPLALSELEMTQEQFIDLCILMGCDYCESIRGIGPKKAIQLIKDHKCIEDIIEKVKDKYPPPENWLYKEARELFKNPDVEEGSTFDLKWTDPDEEAVVEFLCTQKGFSEERVRNACKKLTKARKGSTQGRLDSFFKVTVEPKKRKVDTKNGSAKKKAKTGGGRFKGR